MARSQKRRRRHIVFTFAVLITVIASVLLAVFLTRKKEESPRPAPRKAVIVVKPADVFVWIWDLDDAERKAGSLEGIIRKLKYNGIAGIILCTCRDDKWFNDRAKVDRMIDLADQNQLTIFGYGRFLKSHQKGAKQRVIEAIQDGADGFTFDLEGEYETPDGAAAATDLIGSTKSWCMKNGYEDVAELLSCSSFGLPSRHPKFPQTTIQELCSWDNPQLYASSWRKNWGWSMTKSQELITKEYEGSERMIAPVLQAYGEASGYTPTSPDDLREMLRFSTTLDNVVYISIFRFELMDDALWKVIRSYTRPEAEQKSRHQNRPIIALPRETGRRVFLF